MNGINGQRLKEARNRAGMTAADVAAMLGITRAQFSNIELGKSDTTTANLSEICFLLNVSADYLLELSSDRKRKTFEPEPLPFDVLN